MGVKNVEYQNLVEASNHLHNVIYNYIEENGYDDKLSILLQGKTMWLEMIKERYATKECK